MSKYNGKPPFASEFGWNNQDPTRQENYMKSFNVAPETYPNNPTTPQIYETARKRLVKLEKNRKDALLWDRNETLINTPLSVQQRMVQHRPSSSPSLPLRLSSPENVDPSFHRKRNSRFRSRKSTALDIDDSNDAYFVSMAPKKLSADDEQARRRVKEMQRQWLEYNDTVNDTVSHKGQGRSRGGNQKGRNGSSSSFHSDKLAWI